ncbi:hypothetical protein D3C77_719310 [compost metagenome]
MHRAWRPVALAHLVEHGAADADTGVGFEAGALAGVVLLRCLQQADHPGLDQVVDLDAGRQACEQVVGNALDQRRILVDQTMLGILRLSLAVIHSESSSRHS